MSATVRTSIYIGYESADEVATVKAFIYKAMQDSEVEGFTIYTGEGVWRGEPETAIVIEVIGDDPDLDHKITEVAFRLKDLDGLEQESIYILREMVDMVVL